MDPIGLMRLLLKDFSAVQVLIVVVIIILTALSVLFVASRISGIGVLDLIKRAFKNAALEGINNLTIKLDKMSSSSDEVLAQLKTVISGETPAHQETHEQLKNNDQLLRKISSDLTTIKLAINTKFDSLNNGNTNRDKLYESRYNDQKQLILNITEKLSQLNNSIETIRNLQLEISTLKNQIENMSKILDQMVIDQKVQAAANALIANHNTLNRQGINL